MKSKKLFTRPALGSAHSASLWQRMPQPGRANPPPFANLGAEKVLMLEKGLRAGQCDVSGRIVLSTPTEMHHGIREEVPLRTV